MSFYLGPFYFEEKDLFLLLAIGLMVFGWANGLNLPFISYPTLVILTILFLVAKGLLLRTYESLIYVVFLIAVVLSNFFSLPMVIFYVFFSFLFLRLLKLI